MKTRTFLTVALLTVILGACQQSIFVKRKHRDGFHWSGMAKRDKHSLKTKNVKSETRTIAARIIQKNSKKEVKSMGFQNPSPANQSVNYEHKFLTNSMKFVSNRQKESKLQLEENTSRLTVSNMQPIDSSKDNKTGSYFWTTLSFITKCLMLLVMAAGIYLSFLGLYFIIGLFLFRIGAINLLGASMGLNLNLSGLFDGVFEFIGLGFFVSFIGLVAVAILFFIFGFKKFSKMKLFKKQRGIL